jgi:hypothetical protein
MTVLDFGHPLTDAQKAMLEQETGLTVDRVFAIDTQVDTAGALAPQVSAWLNGVPLSATEWQTEPIVVVLPSLNYSAALLLAVIHGRTGHFPTIVRLRPAPDSLVQRFDVAEIINLQSVREEARSRRTEP